MIANDFGANKNLNMAVYCQICGAQNTDPGMYANLQDYRCGRCGNKALQRVATPQDRKNQAVIGTVLGAGIGGAIGGPPGAVVGGIIGALISGSNPPEIKK